MTSSNQPIKTLCSTCRKSAGILACHGCKQSFCGKHAIEHRQDLGQQLDVIMQEHDIIQNSIQKTSTNQSLLKQIDHWEKESITKIQSAANLARTNLQILSEQTKEKYSKQSYDLAVELLASREADDYTEIDFIRWKEQFNKLKLEIKIPSTIKMVYNKTSTIRLIQIESTESIKHELPIDKQPPVLPIEPEQRIKFKFSTVTGPCTLENNGSVARHSNTCNGCAYISGNLLYGNGQHTMRFQIQSFKQLYCIFFGCISSQTVLKEEIYKSPNCIGWFGNNQVYEHGRCETNCKKHHYYSSAIKTNDVLQITFDCDHNQIKLYNERLQMTSVLNVDIKKTPYPWQLLMVLGSKYDCVKILSDA